MKWMLVLLATIGMAGCATASIMRDPTTAVAHPGTSLVVIQRDSSIAPVASLPVAIFVDGRLVGSVENGRVLHLYLGIGHRVLGIAPVGRVAPTKPQSEIDVHVAESEASVFRVHYVAAGWGGLKIEPMHH
jgi:hypothetical protein